MSTGENIKNHLRARQMSTYDLEIKTGLSNADIKNLLYNKSRNLNKLTLVAEALQIPISYLLPTTLPAEFCYRTYTLAVKIVCSNFESLAIKSDKTIFDEYVARIYHYIMSNTQKSESELQTYCEGMLQNAITTGTIKHIK